MEEVRLRIYKPYNADRFNGEAETPPVAMKDAYGKPIREGEDYYEADDMILSVDSARKMAWMEFELKAKKKTA